MNKKIFLATNNDGKTQRFKYLLENAGANVEILLPKDFGLEEMEVEENGKDLAENAEIKARAYFGKVDLPILSNDTGCWVDGEGMIDTPKRIALKSLDEKDFTKEEIAKIMLEFWKNLAKKHGGKVDAAWIEEFFLLNPDGTFRRTQSRREVILTDQEFGKSHSQLAIRALYISKFTNKPAILHTKEEELLELEPVTEALLKILN